MSYQRLLVIANETIAGDALYDHIHELTADGGRVIIIAPALGSRLKYIFSDVDQPRAAARRRLDESLRLLAEHGIHAEGEVGDINPVRAFEDAVAVFEPDAVLVSTHPAGRSHWLERGEVEKIRARTDLPVEHVVVDLAAEADRQLSSA
jgi:GABA permease